MQIRPERRHDADAVGVVVAEAFGDEGAAIARLVVGLREDASYRPGRALVALVDDAIVGFVLVTNSTMGDADRIATLSPLAVIPAYQGRGIGGSLVTAVLDRCRDDGEVAVALEGAPAYYGRFGFEPAAPFGLVLPLPDWAPQAAAQVAVLGARDEVPSGDVRYSAPFDDLGH